MLRPVGESTVHSPQSIVKDIVLCAGSAVLLILSFPVFNLEFLAWAGFIPLFFVLRRVSWRRAFIVGYIAGVVFWTGIIYWLVHVTLPGTVLLVLYLSFFFGIFGVFSSFLLRSSSVTNLFIIPAVWTLLEYLRGQLLTGFPWALLGYSQFLNLPVIQIADLFGPWAVSFFVMTVNIALFWLCETQTSLQQKRAVLLIEAFLITAVLGYGHFALSTHRSLKGKAELLVSVIQANIPQELKWDPTARDEIMMHYENTSRRARADNPQLLIWPEAALPAVVQEHPQYFQEVVELIKRLGVPLLLGAVTLDEENYYNSALLISSQGELLQKYNKVHLVPFGEYIPLRRMFPFLQSIVPIGDITKGKALSVFELSGHAFSVLICFEDLFPALSRAFVRQGAGFLVNITNDAWYKRTSAAAQHLQASVFRAVENRVFLVRSTNTGISAFISPRGEIVSGVRDEKGNALFIRGYDTKSISSKAGALTVYTRYGDFFIALCALLWVSGIMMRLK